MAGPNFATAPIDCDYLIESGLLFEINRQLLHPLGLALSVQVDARGNKNWSFRDFRAEPEKAGFDRKALQGGRDRFEHFMRAFGFAQMERRTRKLGQAVQYVECWVRGRDS